MIKTLNLRLIIVVVLAQMALLFYASFTPVLGRASAATPGCYQKSGAVLSADKTQTTVQAVECPPGLDRTDILCYVANVTVSSGGSSVGEYDSVDCGSFGVGSTTSGPASPSYEQQLDLECEDDVLDRSCPIIDYLIKGINFLSAVAAMAIIASIMIAGFQYMTARDNSGQVEAARKRITWAIVALLLLIFMYPFLQWVVPGGVL